MPDIAILTNQEDVFPIGADDGTNPRQAGFSIKTAPYPAGYCVVVGTDCHFVPKAAGSFTVTLTGHSGDGTPLSSIVRTYACNAPPPPQATRLTAGGPSLRGQDITTPADPGSDTVAGTLNPGL